MQPIVEHIWKGKYRHEKEKDREATLRRVVEAVYAQDPNEAERERALSATLSLRWCPAGRIIAGAGTDKRVTLINCYVSPTIQDSMETEGEGPSVGIMDALKVAALTQQMGGGIGMDFSTLRPAGAVVKRGGAVASGPLPFMDMWNSMCQTVMSSGSRRGAMMATLRCDHPDIEAFITAKREPGRLTNFNVSVLVTDSFMEAVKKDEPWDLVFHDVPPVAPTESWFRQDRLYVYKILPARYLWDLILRNTYEHSEPGVIFIDRINQLNNLSYREQIATTNPCGEQPLPPNGACNLGAVNLERHVLHPFEQTACIDYESLLNTVEVGVRFLDNTLDITQHPTSAQAKEAWLKRRIGLGVTGLGNMLQKLRFRYGSPEALHEIETLMQFIANTAYKTSAQLAKERGSFPLYDREEFNQNFLLRLSSTARKHVQDMGLRNGVLLTVAPTGTTSLFYDNVSSGIEPTFAWNAKREVLLADGTRQEFDVYDKGWLDYCHHTDLDPRHATKGGPRPDDSFMVTTEQLSLDDHLLTQAAVQRWVDSSISKTINLPREISFEDFRGVYTKAYELGLKGVTTYRPSPVRGAVLRSAEPQSPTPETQAAPFPKRLRPETLTGKTYKVRWPHAEKAYYLTINDGPDGRPFELFINGGDEGQREWSGALAKLSSALLRRGDSVEFLIEELEQVHSATGGAFMGERFHHVPSAVALVGRVLREHTSGTHLEPGLPSPSAEWQPSSRVCPRCNVPGLARREGCDQCPLCGYNKCD